MVRCVRGEVVLCVVYVCVVCRMHAAVDTVSCVGLMIIT